MYCKKKSVNNTNINPGIFIWSNFKYSYDHQLDIPVFKSPCSIPSSTLSSLLVHSRDSNIAVKQHGR